jgi:hypothetical protein
VSVSEDRALRHPPRSSPRPVGSGPPPTPRIFRWSCRCPASRSSARAVTTRR